MRIKTIVTVAGAIIIAVLILGFFGAHYAISLFDRSAPPLPEMTPGSGAVYGYVTAAKPGLLPGVPMLPEAGVTLSPGGYTTKSDRNGVYYLTDIPPGTYTLIFSKDGYEDFPVSTVRVMAGQALYLDGSLFPVAKGPAVAHIRLTTAMGVGKVPVEFPYNSTVYIDAGKSKNASREGFRWEVYGPDGLQLTDPHNTDKPFAPQVSEMPKASPFLFTLQLPAAGEYTVRLFLSNRLEAAEAAAEVKIKAVNVAPVALPRVFPGPLPPQKGGNPLSPVSRGSVTASTGESVHLRGFALDPNYPTPEKYNPGGTQPDVYGQNNDHYQRAFSWQWRLELEAADGVRDVTSWLRTPEGIPGTNTQHIWFLAQDAGTYRAYLTVGDNDPYGPLQSLEASLDVLVLDDAIMADEAACLDCHGPAGRYPAGDVPKTATVHGQAGRATCQDCHGPGRAHLAAKKPADKRKTMTVTRDAGLCGRCHQQYNEWQKSFHSDGYAFGHSEIARPLLINCTKCHYAEGFARTVATMERDGVGFKNVSSMKPLFPAGPLFFDFSMLPEPDGSGISCTVCHNPHGRATADNPTALRLGSPDALCATCHEEKWHNVLLQGTAGRSGSAVEAPGSEPPAANPHLTNRSCVLCHMDTSVETVDANGIRDVGGHTLRMRAVGQGTTLGGYGPRWDDRTAMRPGEEAGNTLNTAPCLTCHREAATFNLNNVQAENAALWQELGELLRAKNNGVLPGYQPGDKCATCHRGGTLPFDNDPDLLLESAYTNYKLIGNDRSWGIHNPGYIRRLLIDSINSLQ